MSDWAALARQLDAKHIFGFFLHPNPLITLLTTAAAALAALAALGLLAAAAAAASPLGLRLGLRRPGLAARLIGESGSLTLP